MSDFVSIEDADNIRALLLFHLGHPEPTMDGTRLGLLDKQSFDRLEEDLLRYCTRLRCQPDTGKHTEVIAGDRYSVPAHQLIKYPPRHAR